MSSLNYPASIAHAIVAPALSLSWWIMGEGVYKDARRVGCRRDIDELCSAFAVQGRWVRGFPAARLDAMGCSDV